MSSDFNWPLLFGYTGTFLCISSFLFQIYQVFKNKSAKDVSYGFIIFQLLVNILFTIYNSIVFNLPLLINNSSLTGLILILLLQKIYYDVYLVKSREKRNKKEIAIREVMETVDENLVTVQDIELGHEYGKECEEHNED